MNFKYLILSLSLLLTSFSQAAVQVCTFADHWDPQAKKYNSKLPCWDVLSANILPSSFMHVEVEVKKATTNRKIIIHTSSKTTSERLLTVLLRNEFEGQKVETLFLYGSIDGEEISFINKDGIVEEELTQWIWMSYLQVDKRRKNQLVKRSRHLREVIGFYVYDREEDF